MEFRTRDTQEILTESELKARFPLKLVPKVFKAATLDSFNVDAVLQAPRPEPSGPLKMVIRDGADLDGLGNLVQKYIEVDKFEDSEQLSKADQEQAYLAQLAADELKRQLAIIEAEFAAATGQIKAGYTRDEIDSWPIQLSEATAYTADSEAPTPLLDAMISQNGLTKAQLSTKILNNAAAFKLAFGVALGKKQKQLADLAS